MERQILAEYTVRVWSDGQFDCKRVDQIGWTENGISLAVPEDWLDNDFEDDEFAELFDDDIGDKNGSHGLDAVFGAEDEMRPLFYVGKDCEEE